MGAIVYDPGFIEKYGDMMKELSGKWGSKEPYYELHPVETKIMVKEKINRELYCRISHIKKSAAYEELNG